jgi:hypothetical protein
MITDKRPLRPGFLILLCLFNCALLLHFGTSGWPYLKTTVVIALMTGIQFLNYRLWWPCAVSVIICLAGFLITVPRQANHFNMELFIGLIILGFLAYRYTGFKNHIAPETISRTIRLTLITIYFISGFHKLNSGFFNLDGSCATFINLKLFGDDIVLPDVMVRVLQVATIATEMILPFGLLHHKSRKPTVFLLALFHLYLALCNFSNFSAFAVFLLIGSSIDLSATNLSSFKNGLRTYMGFCLAAATAGFMARHPFEHPRVYILLRGILFCIGCAVLCKTFLFKKDLARQPYKPSVVPMLVVTLLILWGLQCYIGLSTGRNFNMFSNLVTEKNRNNHFLIDTQKTKIWNFEEDLVTIVQLPEGIKKFNMVDPAEYDFPLIEFKKVAHKWAGKKKKMSCTIIYKGKLIHIDDFKQSEFARTEWWEHFLFYRPVPKEGTNPCMW